MIVSTNLLNSPVNTGPGNFGRRLSAALLPLGVILISDGIREPSHLYLASAYMYDAALDNFPNRCVFRIDGLIPLEYNRAFRESAVHIYQSKYSRDELQKPHQYIHPNSYVIYNGVPVQPVIEHVPSEHINLLSIINNWNEFRYKVFMEVIVDNAAAIQASFPNLRWRIVGNSNEFKNAIQAKGDIPSFMEFIGFTTDFDTLRSEASALLHLVQKDSCPNSIIESMMCGTPIIGWQDSAGPELIANGGVIIENTDAEHVVAKIQDMLDNRNTYATNARQIALESYDIDVVAKQYKEVFESAIS